jgi:hypothetical protein
MPYIKPDRRLKYNLLLEVLARIIAEENANNCTSFVGDWNYCITKLIKSTLKVENCNKNYTQQNEIMGMFECCKHEWYRKEVAPYEDLKAKENGEVE